MSRSITLSLFTKYYEDYVLYTKHKLDRILMVARVFFSLVGFQLPVRELDLLPGLEGGHTQIGTAGTAKGISQIALLRQATKTRNMLT